MPTYGYRYTWELSHGADLTNSKYIHNLPEQTQLGQSHRQPQASPGPASLQPQLGSASTSQRPAMPAPSQPLLQFRVQQQAKPNPSQCPVQPQGKSWEAQGTPGAASPRAPQGFRNAVKK